MLMEGNLLNYKKILITITITIIITLKITITIIITLTLTIIMVMLMSWIMKCRQKILQTNRISSLIFKISSLIYKK